MPFLFLLFLVLMGCSGVPGIENKQAIINYLQGNWQTEAENVSHRFVIQGNTIKYWSDGSTEPAWTSAYSLSDIYPNFRDNKQARELLIQNESNMFKQGSFIFIEDDGLYFEDFPLTKVNE